MRKTYITPALKVRNFTPHTILAGSTKEVPVDTTGGTTVDGTSGGMAKDATGFDWGDTWSNNEESEN